MLVLRMLVLLLLMLLLMPVRFRFAPLVFFNPEMAHGISMVAPRSDPVG